MRTINPSVHPSSNLWSIHLEILGNVVAIYKLHWDSSFSRDDLGSRWDLCRDGRAYWVIHLYLVSIVWSRQIHMAQSEKVGELVVVFGKFICFFIINYVSMSTSLWSVIGEMRSIIMIDVSIVSLGWLVWCVGCLMCVAIRYSDFKLCVKMCAGLLWNCCVSICRVWWIAVFDVCSNQILWV